MKKLTLFAMTAKGYEVLTALHRTSPTLIAQVVSSRDEGLLEDHYQTIARYCADHRIAFADRATFKSIATPYAIAVSWRWMIPVESTQLIVFHDSILPRHRGFNPLVTALINGEKTVGVTALYATMEFDRGPIIAQSISNISYPIRIQDAILAVLKNYAELAVRIADDLCRDIDPVGEPQLEADASYSLWRDEEDYYIDWTKDSRLIKRTIDALGFPYRGAMATMAGRPVRVLNAEVVDDVSISNRSAGKVLFVEGSRPIVVCGEGLLRIDELVDAAGNQLLPLERFRVRFKGAQ